jgi:hypothetical protein
MKGDLFSAKRILRQSWTKRKKVYRKREGDFNRLALEKTGEKIFSENGFLSGICQYP